MKAIHLCEICQYAKYISILVVTCSKIILSLFNPQTRIKLKAENLGFCIKHFNYVVLFTQTLSMPALAICQFIQSFCAHQVIIYLTSYSSIYKVLPWDG